MFLSDQIYNIIKDNIDVIKNDIDEANNISHEILILCLDKAQENIQGDYDLFKNIRRINNIWNSVIDKLEKENILFFVKDGFKIFILNQLPELKGKI